MDEVQTKQPTEHVVVPWNPLLALLLVIVLYVVAQAFGELILSLVPQLLGWSAAQTQEWITNNVAGQFAYVFIVEALTIAGLLLFLKRHKTKVSVLGMKRPRLRDAGYGLMAYPIYFLIFAVITVIASQLIPSLNVTQKQELGFDNVQGTVPLVLTFISLVILPPLVEEFLFRGFLYTSMRKYLKFIGAALVTSLLFAVAHLPAGGAAGPLYIAAIDTFLLSLVLCFLREKTGSLWAGITLHALKNCVAFVSLFILATR